ncbi:MAG: YqjF family protein [Limisphaerales bacterium]
MDATKSSPPKVFLTAEWRFLAMLNYEIEPVALVPFIPTGTELDFWDGKTYVSLVGFLFQNTRVRGIPILSHRNFEEVNLRFYVRRKAGDGWRRGVVFIKELVPRRAVAFVARKFFNENYYASPMAHHIENVQEEVKSASFFWWPNGRENSLKVTVRGHPRPLVDGSLPEFIAGHYWGYAKQRDGSTMEYHVEHPRWKIWETQAAECHCDAADLYDEPFRGLFSCPPVSAFLADGSEVKVYQGVKLTT